MEPQMRYCTSSDGTRLAYWILGDGPVLLTASPCTANPGMEWTDQPVSRAGYERLAEYFRYVIPLARGTGALQRDVVDLSINAQVADLNAVVESLGEKLVDILGVVDGTSIAMAYAAKYPERVGKLVLWAPYAYGPEVYPRERIDEVVELVRTNWSLARRVIAATAMPNGPIDAQRSWSIATREAIEPETFVKYLEVSAGVDLRDVLAEVRAPTLVLLRSGGRVVPTHASMAVAAAIPDSRLVVLEGETSYLWQDDTTWIDTALDFLNAGRATAPRARGDLPTGTAIILFADIVDSTALTERLGDDAFREKARGLDAAMRAAIRENGGTAVEGKTLGDGVLAVFTSAKQAIACAKACHEVASAAGLSLHAGIHAGDVIREADPDGRGNVYGGAVNIAARVAAASGAGETLVSGTVRDLARTSAGVVFEDRGEQQLKGIGEAVRVWVVRGA